MLARIGRRPRGRSERDVAWSIQETFHEVGADGMRLRRSSRRTSGRPQPHAEPSSDVIGAGTLVTIDLGGVLDGYCSDCTRTFATGPLPERLEEAYAICLEAQLAAMEGIRPGLTCKDADGDRARHHHGGGARRALRPPLGHGVGLEIHEDPRLSAISPATLEPGMVVTVEPGIYLPGSEGFASRIWSS